MVEIAGKLSQVTDAEQLRILRKAACNPNNGQDVYFAQFNYRDHKQRAPQILYFKTPHFTREENNALLPLRTVGIFSLADETQTFTIRFDELDLPGGSYRLTDVWSGEQIAANEQFTITLEPHSSRLLAVSTNDVRVLDANIRLNSVRETNTGLLLVADYALTDVELTLDRVPSAIRQGRNAIPFTVDGTTVQFDLAHAGEFEIVW